MYTKHALRLLGVTGREMTEAQRASLDDNGFFVVEGVFASAQCRVMGEEFDHLSALEGEKSGHEVHVEPGAPRVSDIFNKSAVYDCCLEIKPFLAASHHLLGEFKVHGANLREPLKGRGHQDLHVDVPKLFADDWWVSNAIVTFDDMTEDNGPARVVPGSHRWQPINVPYANSGDLKQGPLTPEEQARAPKDLAAPYPGEVRVIAPMGSVIVINSSLWHAGTKNESGARRRVLHLTYTRRDLPQQLVQRAYLTAALYERMSPAHRFLLDIDELPAGAQPMRSARGTNAGTDWWKPDAAAQ
jgi:hypothetical protein